MYLECCELPLQIQNIYDTPSFILLAPALSAQLFRLSYYMDHTFLGIDATTKVSVGFFRVLANLVWFFGMARNRAASSSTLRSRKQELGSTREYFQSMLQLAVKRMTGLLQQMDQPEVDHRRVQTHRAVLGDLRSAVLQALKSPSTQEIIKLMSNIVVRSAFSWMHRAFIIEENIVSQLTRHVCSFSFSLEHCADADQPEKLGPQQNRGPSDATAP